MGRRQSTAVRNQKRLIALVKERIVYDSDWMPIDQLYKDLKALVQADGTTDDQFKATLLPIIEDYLGEYYSDKSDSIQRAKAHTEEETTSEGI